MKYLPIIFIYIFISGCTSPPKPSAFPNTFMTYNSTMEWFAKHPPKYLDIWSLSTKEQNGECSSCRNNQTTLKNRKLISKIFSNLLSNNEPVPDENGMVRVISHGCLGNIKFEFPSDGQILSLSFDHASGVESEFGYGGYLELSVSNRYELVDILRDLGFEYSDIAVDVEINNLLNEWTRLQKTK